jgi:GDP-4-dehydro-6-deoxy-D-mannose reductase
VSPVLVTGAAGFVGSHLLELLSQDGTDIVGWYRPGTEPPPTGPNVRWVSVEMHSAPDVVSAFADANPASIYHLAGSAHVGDSWRHTHETFAGNVLASSHLLEAIRQSALRPRVLITGSAAIYTPIDDRALTEHDPVLPTSPYGTSKLAQEMLGVRAWEEDGIPTILARAFNHVGPRQAPSYVASGIARQIASIEAGTMEPVLTMGNLEPRRDIMDVRDTVRAYREMMRAAKPGAPYNVCSGRAVAIRELVEMFRSRSRVLVRMETDLTRFRPKDVPLLLGDHTKLTTDTGWTPQISLEETVDDLLTYWRQSI